MGRATRRPLKPLGKGLWSTRKSSEITTSHPPESSMNAETYTISMSSHEMASPYWASDLKEKTKQRPIFLSWKPSINTRIGYGNCKAMASMQIKSNQSPHSIDRKPIHLEIQHWSLLPDYSLSMHDKIYRKCKPSELE